MQGDPFSAIKLLDRAKLIYFGVRDYFVGLVEQEKKEFEAAHEVIERDVIPDDGDDCPQCGAGSTMRLVSAGVVRCQQCAWQPRIHNPSGSPNRTQLESWSSYSPEHKRKFQQGFGSAVARIVRPRE